MLLELSLGTCFLRAFAYSFNKHISGPYRAPGAVAGPGNAAGTTEVKILPCRRWLLIAPSHRRVPFHRMNEPYLTSLFYCRWVFGQFPVTGYLSILDRVVFLTPAALFPKHRNGPACRPRTEDSYPLARAREQRPFRPDGVLHLLMSPPRPPFPRGFPVSSMARVPRPRGIRVCRGAPIPGRGSRPL